MWDLIVKNKTLRGVAGDIWSREGLRHRLQRNQEIKTTIFFKKLMQLNLSIIRNEIQGEMTNNDDINDNQPY